MEQITVRLTKGTEGMIYLGKTPVQPAVRRVNPRTLHPLPLQENPWVTVSLTDENRQEVLRKVEFYQKAGKLEVKGEGEQIVGSTIEVEREKKTGLSKDADGLSELSWQELRAKAKELGINIHGLTREEVEQKIKEKSEGESKDRSADQNDE